MPVDVSSLTNLFNDIPRDKILDFIRTPSRTKDFTNYIEIYMVPIKIFLDMLRHHYSKKETSYRLINV